MPTASSPDTRAIHAATGAPEPWVTGFSHLVHGHVLDVACGSGRHVRHFLARGHAVTALERNTDGLADLAGTPALEIIAVDLEDDGAGGDANWPLGERRFGAVIVTNYLWRPLLPHIVAAVGDGGVLLYQTFAAGNEAFGRPRNPAHLLQPGELLDAVAGQLQVVAYEQGRSDRPSPAVIQRICAVRSSVPAPLAAG